MHIHNRKFMPSVFKATKKFTFGCCFIKYEMNSIDVFSLSPPTAYTVISRKVLIMTGRVLTTRTVNMNADSNEKKESNVIFSPFSFQCEQHTTNTVKAYVAIEMRAHGTMDILEAHERMPFD